MRKSIPATSSLIALNVLIYFTVDLLLPAGNPLARRLPLYYPRNEAFGVWQFVSHMFMHGSTTHLFMNMFGLFSFGSILERIWGTKRFLIFYFAAGVGAGIIYTGVNLFEVFRTASLLIQQGLTAAELTELPRITDDPRVFAYGIQQLSPAGYEAAGPEKIVEMFYIFKIPVVGASGAIYGVLTAFGVLFPNAKLSLIFLPVPIAAKYFIPALLLLDFFSGVTGFSLFGGGIAHFAHLGGAAIGFLLMLLWRKDRPV
ncbi:MAG: rhomboid family intramembrane serine protease [Kiritimatiellia bacterium]